MAHKGRTTRELPVARDMLTALMAALDVPYPARHGDIPQRDTVLTTRVAYIRGVVRAAAIQSDPLDELSLRVLADELSRAATQVPVSYPVLHPERERGAG